MEMSPRARGKIIRVAEGYCEFGDKNTKFLSQGFTSCSGLILRDQYETTYGLFHILPSQELLYMDIDHNESVLKLFSGGSAVLVQGSLSTGKYTFLNGLYERFGIKIEDTEPIETVNNKGENKAFHILFVPKSNRLIVARTSHEDVLNFKIF